MVAWHVTVAVTVGSDGSAAVSVLCANEIDICICNQLQLNFAGFSIGWCEALVACFHDTFAIFLYKMTTSCSGANGEVATESQPI